MKILVTNDDGFQSPFLEILCKALKIDHEVVMVAPFKEQSGIGQAISIYNSLTYAPLSQFDFEAYSVMGTPSDCIKFSVCHLYKEQKFDLVVSGINPGENAGLSALYSGTVAGAREGATWGIPSVALSVWDNNPIRAELAALWFCKLLEKKSIMSMSPGSFWNINFPHSHIGEEKGVKLCSMSQAMFKDHYQEFITPRKSSEFWLDGYKHKEQFSDQSDDLELLNEYITITPLQIDQTNIPELKRLKSLQEELNAPA